jgi:hypothetical protein
MRPHNYRLVIVSVVIIITSFVLTQSYDALIDHAHDVPDTDPQAQLVSAWMVSSAHAKPKRKKKRAKRKRKKRYDRARREAKKLLDAGHPTVQLTLKTKPRVRAVVYHGKEELGSTPLQLTWTKDTGPIDIKLRAAGYLTVNSRLYTHRNDHVTVQMFKTDEAHLLFGYKKKVKSKTEETPTEE